MPPDITILGIRYQLIQKENIHKGEWYQGEIDHIEQTITIDNTMSSERKQLTLWHEILHAICEIQGLKELGEDERAIQSLAVGLYSLSTLNEAITF